MSSIDLDKQNKVVHWSSRKEMAKNGNKKRARSMCLITLGVLLANVVAGAGAEIAPIPADPTKQLVLDQRVVARTQGLRLVMGQVEKEPSNPLFRADRPWENALNNLYPNLLWDQDERVFKLWYKCVLVEPAVIAKMMPPATVHDVGWFLLYATSADGLTWQKPDLGLIGFDGSTRTNIVARDTPNVGVFKDPHDADPGRRYKMIYDVGSGKMRVRFSLDGLRWSEPAEPQGFTAFTGDTHNNAFWDARQQAYICLTRFYLGERLVARSQSRDFLHWENTQLALRSTLAEGRGRQLYCMPAFPYANGYIGFLMAYNAGTDRTVDCELAYSPDTVIWQRILPGTSLLPRGPAGSYDGACIYAQSGSPVLKDGRMMIFYGGSDQVHRGWKRHCLPCVAYLRPDGFAGYEPAEPGGAGLLVTSPVKLLGRPLQISADAAGGQVVVTLLDDHGNRLAVCRPVSDDVTDENLELTGRGKWDDLAGTVVQLQFALQQARLYAFRGAELVARVETASAAESRPAPARRAANAAAVRTAFDRDAEGWQGNSRLEYRADGGVPGGHLRVERTGGQAFASADAGACGGKLVGNWPQRFGGEGAEIVFQLRSDPPPLRVSVELFAGDVAQWSCDLAPAAGTNWSEYRAALRYDWTEAEARAAGWRSAIQAFSWRETIQHVGRLVVVPLLAGTDTAFEFDELTVRALED